MRLATGILTAGLVLSPAAWAQDRGYDRPGSYRFEMPREYEMDEVLTSARRLDTLLEGMNRHMNDFTDELRLDRIEARSLRWLEVLAFHADAFEDALENDLTSPERSADEFERLMGAYLRTRNEDFSWLPAGRISDEFRELRRSMDEVAEYYGGYPERDSRDYHRMLSRVDIDDAADFRLSIGGNRLGLDVPDLDLELN